MTWWWVDTGWACGGLEVVDGRVVGGAPIFGKFCGQRFERIRKHYRTKQLAKLRKIKRRCVIGIDPSPLGSGGVVYVENSLVDYWFCTEAAGVAAKFPDRALLIPKNEGENSRIERVRIQWEKVRQVVRRYRPEVVGLEDYIWTPSFSVYQIAELGGVLRLGLSSIVPVRTWPPDSVKLARAGSFKATKEEMIQVAVAELEAAGTELAAEILDLSKRTNTEKGNKYLEAVSDAMAVRDLTQREIDYRERIQRGENPLKDWPENVVKVFHRVTKNVPCVLDRPFLKRGESDGIRPNHS